MDTGLCCTDPIPCRAGVRDQQLGTGEGEIDAAAQCLFVRASLLYLLAGFLIGALILAQKGIPYSADVWTLFPIHMEFLLIGWFAQLAMGVAFWIVPRFSSGPPRGKESLIWVSFVLINTGLLIGILQLWLNPSALLGRILEICAGITFTIGMWRRIKPHGVFKTTS